jgi:hypothetical protein
MAESEAQLYLCPRCFLAGEDPGPCPACGAERLTCRPGRPDDPCRKPLIDRSGQIRSRAPRWWLRQTVRRLTDFLEQA